MRKIYLYGTRALLCVLMLFILLTCLALSGCLMEFMMGSTAWLDFQHTSADMKRLFAKDRIGMTKAQLLAEISEVEYSWMAFDSNAYTDLPARTPIFMSVLFPSNVAEHVIAQIKRPKCRAMRSVCGSIDYQTITADTQEGRVPRPFEYIDGGLEFSFSPREWGLSSVADFESFLSSPPNLDDSAVTSDAECRREWVRFFLQKSSHWAVFTRRQSGPTYQWFGFVYYDSLIVEFDSSGIIVNQRKVTWGIGDG